MFYNKIICIIILGLFMFLYSLKVTKVDIFGCRDIETMKEPLKYKNYPRCDMISDYPQNYNYDNNYNPNCLDIYHWENETIIYLCHVEKYAIFPYIFCEDNKDKICMHENKKQSDRESHSMMIHRL